MINSSNFRLLEKQVKHNWYRTYSVWTKLLYLCNPSQRVNDHVARLPSLYNIFSKMTWFFSAKVLNLCEAFLEVIINICDNTIFLQIFSSTRWDECNPRTHILAHRKLQSWHFSTTQLYPNMFRQANDNIIRNTTHSVTVVQKSPVFPYREGSWYFWGRTSAFRRRLFLHC